MNTNKLKSVLNEAKEKFSDISEDEQKKLLSWPGELPLQLSRLNNLLQKTQWLKLFDNKMRVLENSSCLVDYNGLSKWLIYRALKVGVDKTIKDLTHYINEPDINEPEFKYYQILSLSGIKIESELQLSDGIRLVPFSTLPESGHKRMHESGMAFGIFVLPSAALIREKLHVRDHINSGASRNKAQNWRREFYDALLCLTVVERIGISSLSSWLTIDDSVPLGGHFHLSGALSSSDIVGSIVSKKVDTTTYNRAKRIHKEFTKLTEKDRKILRIAMSRLNSALLQHPFVDSAIDIRVALENIFLTDGERGEYTFKIRSRAARFLRKDLAERLKLDGIFKDLYALGSGAVHSGKLTDIKKRKASSILEDGYLYISEAVEKIILNKGFPDWEKILLS